MLAKSSLRARFLIVLLVSLLPILILISALAYLDLETERKRAASQIQVRAEAARLKADEYIKDSELALRLSARILQTPNGCKSALANIAETIPVVTNVLTISTDGTILCSAIARSGGPIDNENWMPPLISGQNVLITNAFFGSQSERWIFAVLRRNEAPDGTLIDIHAAALDANLMLASIDERVADSELKVALMDADGNMFGNAGLSDLPRGLSSSATEQGDLTRVSSNGSDYNVITLPIGPQNIRLMLAAPVPTFWDVLTSSPAQIITLPLLAILTAGLAFWWGLSRFVLRWLSRLSRVVDIYAGGRYKLQDNETIRHAPREISNLASGLNVMSNQIAEREHRLEKALETRDAAIKEVHHRVKNNLQIVTSFLNLESRSSYSKEAKSVLDKARTRISALSIVHQTLYQYERLDQVDVKPFIRVLTDHLNTALGLQDAGVSMSTEVEEASISSDDAIPLALAILELVTNSMKYAFDGHGGKIDVGFRRQNNMFELTVADDGRGSDSDSETGTGLGTRLLKAFARQLGGRLDVQIEKGRTATIAFPDKAQN